MPSLYDSPISYTFRKEVYSQCHCTFIHPLMDAKKTHHMIDFYETRANTIAIRIVWVHCMQYKREDPNDFLPYRLKTSHFTKNNKVYSEFIYSAFVISRSGHAHLLTPSEWMVRIYTHLQNRLANVSYGLKCRLSSKQKLPTPPTAKT